VIRSIVRLVLATALVSAVSAPRALAQQEDDAVLKPAEPDFTLVSLPTALRLPLHGSAFRLTHRFSEPLDTDFGTLAGDLFGLDSSAAIGLEYRFGIAPGTEIGLHRSSSNKVIELFGQYGIARQGGASPVEVAVRGGVEGTDNFSEEFAGSVGVIVSRRAGDHAAFYVEPTWVGNSNAYPPVTADGDNVVMVGVGARVRVLPTVYLVGEYSPVVTGDNERTDHGAFAIEKRIGGHVFQFNFSNTFATTPGQLAHGSVPGNEWHIGFNLTRKFF
jgi:hypothetical protein